MQIFLALVLVASLLAVLAPIHPRVRQACQKHFAVFHIAQAIIVAIATVSATLLFTRLIQQEEKEQVFIQTLERSRSNLESAVNDTEAHISQLKKYPEKYDRVGELFNKPVCYAEISKSHAFGNAKDSLFPRAAYSLLTENDSILAHMALYDEIQKAVEYLKQTKDQQMLACNPRIQACLLCRPSNLLTAYLHRLNLNMAQMFVSVQLDIEKGEYEPSQIQSVVKRRQRELECQFLRDVKLNVAKEFLPPEIRVSVEAINRRCG